ncbi:AAA family ATPase [Mesorhizobium sp. YM1C-6-2]|uniref:AAA family ATPase n=1 Tax=Mesorhizobium sp. YM1C-6-2 TaxID=1827501 RepID=UPI000EF19DAA|nr:AAA family ATPase [Mesorhizobium sp. YM1C-6-2]RLP24681.1 ATPase [Mesorhizobium sp. YM1C-6-2]
MQNPHDRFFVLTGGPGAGKTTLIEALKARGFATTDEAGRGVIREQMQGGGDGLPWLDRERFAELMFDWELRSYRQAERQDGPVIFDRGLPDTIGYLRLEGLEVPAWMEEEALRLRYNRRVFVAPPWKEIYGRDEERRQDWEVAVRTHAVMVETYTELGYELIELPLVSVAQRAAFVLAETGAEVPPRA